MRGEAGLAAEDGDGVAGGASEAAAGTFTYGAAKVLDAIAQAVVALQGVLVDAGLAGIDLIHLAIGRGSENGHEDVGAAL